MYDQDFKAVVVKVAPILSSILLDQSTIAK